MYEITIEGRFTAAHRHALPGRAEAIHGHDFRVLARVAGGELTDDVLIDFHAVETDLERELARIDHRDLSEEPDFKTSGATPAALARWLFERLAPRVPGLASVEVRDTEHTGARYAAKGPPASPPT